MEDILVLALDPGRTTGIAVGRKTERSLKIDYFQEEFEHHPLYDYLESLGHLFLNHIICESFEFRQGKQTGVDLYPCELIGVVKLFQSQWSDITLTMQPASVQGKQAYFSNDKLKDMKLYKRGEQYHHGRSAVKHLLQWFHFGAGFKYMEGFDGTVQIAN